LQLSLGHELSTHSEFDGGLSVGLSVGISGAGGFNGVAGVVLNVAVFEVTTRPTESARTSIV
jgi:hypothetical protein